MKTDRKLFEDLQRAGLEQLGLSPDEVDKAMEPTLSFHAMCAENASEDEPAVTLEQGDWPSQREC